MLEPPLHGLQHWLWRCIFKDNSTGPEIYFWLLWKRYARGKFTSPWLRQGTYGLKIGGGTLSDLFTAEERGKAVAIYSIAPLLGPVLGPVMGGLISQHASWRWAFYAASLLDAVVQLLGLVFLEETYAPVLLRRKQEGLHKTPAVKPSQALRQVRGRLSSNLGRAARLFLTQPIVQVLALYNAFLYGIIFILYATFPSLWTDVYHQSVSISGLHYISLAVGTAFASEVCTHINDRIFASLKQKHRGTTLPEFRVPMMGPATILLSAGLFWYGWSAEHKLFWLMPDIGSAMFMSGAVVCGICVNAYIIDMYKEFSASALAPVAILRCLAAFSFPLFAPYV
jgi:MFS family permease